MDRRQAITGILAAGTFVTADPGTAAVDVAREKIEGLVDRYADAWNTSDMDAMSKLCTEDVHWVNIVGMHWQGKAQVDRAHRAFFDVMFKGVPLKLEEIESVQLVSGGVVVAVVRWSVGAFRTPFGEQQPPSRDRMSLTLAPHGQGYLIAHGANIQIDELAQKSNPVGMRAR